MPQELTDEQKKWARAVLTNGLVAMQRFQKTGRIDRSGAAVLATFAEVWQMMSDADVEGFSLEG